MRVGGSPVGGASPPTPTANP